MAVRVPNNLPCVQLVSARLPEDPRRGFGSSSRRWPGEKSGCVAKGRAKSVVEFSPRLLCESGYSPFQCFYFRPCFWFLRQSHIYLLTPKLVFFAITTEFIRNIKSHQDFVAVFNCEFGNFIYVQCVSFNSGVGSIF